MDLCWAQRCPPGCLQFLFPCSVFVLPEQLHVQPWGVLSEFFLSSHFSSFRETLQTLDGPKLGTSPKIFFLGFCISESYSSTWGSRGTASPPLGSRSAPLSRMLHGFWSTACHSNCPVVFELTDALCEVSCLLVVLHGWHDRAVH